MTARGTATAVLLLLAGVSGAMAAPSSLLERMRARIIASQPFRADFVQQVFIDGELNLEESGFLVFADRARVKWQYLNPERKTFIMENGRYQYYDLESNQLLRGAIDPGSEHVIWDLLCSGEPGGDLRWDERTRTIRLDVQAGGGRQELEIRLAADGLPERVRQVSAPDVVTVYTFRAYRRRIALEPGEFTLDLPGDVEIIENE
jgi:outer membrane lipoprotein-sorting protein